MYKAIVFDLGNVLLDFDYNIIIENLNKVEKNLGGTFAQKYQENFHLHEELETSKISVEEFTQTVLNWLDNKISAKEFYKIYSEMFVPNNEMINLLPKLKKDYKLYLLSNTNYIHKKYGWEQYEFLKYFDKLILSHEVKARKPEKKIFSAAEEIIECKPSELFFTDDIPEYVQAAQNSGWNAVQFTGYPNYLSELKRCKIL